MKLKYFPIRFKILATVLVVITAVVSGRSSSTPRPVLRQVSSSS